MAAAAPPDLADAIQALATAITNMNNPPTTVPITDLFSSGQPFNLATRSGLTAYEQSSEPLKNVWDGEAATFPSFVIQLHLRANKAKWNATDASGILEISGKNLLTDYHKITDAEITAARNGRTDQRALQNAKALYECLKESISGHLHSTIFEQVGNIPDNEDGISLFKKLTNLTSVASLQLSVLSFNKLLHFCPSEHNFVIPTINTELNNLFILATTSHRTLPDSERLHHLVTVYGKVQQPEEWAQWVRNQTDKIEDNTITNSQDFMNSAVLKYNKIINKYGGFKGSITTVQDDIVAMMTQAKLKKPKPENERKPKPETDKLEGDAKHTRPPFVKHYKTKADGTGVEYEVGDTKEWKGQSWHYCDAPNHKGGARWHTHSAENCRTRKRWMKENGKGGETESESKPFANLADGNESTTADREEEQADLTTLLVHALNAVGDNQALRDHIANALQCIDQE